jgi:hypothetical protein
MNIRHPNPNCSMTCTLHNSSQCVCNLIAISGENSPISHGLRMGLGHFYGPRGLPPCVRGKLGSSYWATTVESNAAVPV